MLWEYLLEARQGLLLQVLDSENWEQFLEKRGEITALNLFIEFGDTLLARLEQAQLEAQTDGRGRQGGYHGRNTGEAE